MLNVGPIWFALVKRSDRLLKRIAHLIAFVGSAWAMAQAFTMGSSTEILLAIAMSMTGIILNFITDITGEYLDRIEREKVRSEVNELRIHIKKFQHLLSPRSLSLQTIERLNNCLPHGRLARFTVNHDGGFDSAQLGGQIIKYIEMHGGYVIDRSALIYSDPRASGIHITANTHQEIFGRKLAEAFKPDYEDVTFSISHALITHEIQIIVYRDSKKLGALTETLLHG